MALFEKRGQWYIDYRFEGRRIRECIGPSKRVAERALAARRGEIVQGRFRLAERKRSPRFEEAVTEYMAWARSNNRSWHWKLGATKHLLAAFQGKTLREITPWLVEKYKRERREALVSGRPIRPPTVNRELGCLKHLFNLAIQWGKAESNPVRDVKFFPEDGRRERVLSPEEVQRLLAACTEHSRPFVLLALCSGMRLGEILGLTWEQVDLRQGVLTLTRTKSGKWRKVPLNRVAQALLEQVPRSGPYVFGGARPFGSIKTAFRAACRRAEITGCRFHDLRHTAATYMVLGGKDLATVQEILGHSTVALTMRYTHPTPESKHRAVATLEALVEAGNGHLADTRADSRANARLAARALSAVE